MLSFSQIIDAFEGEFAQAIGIEESHARAMKARDSIPSSYWLRTAKAAEDRSIDGVTLECMAGLHEAKTMHREIAQ